MSQPQQPETNHPSSPNRPSSPETNIENDTPLGSPPPNPGQLRALPGIGPMQRNNQRNVFRGGRLTRRNKAAKKKRGKKTKRRTSKKKKTTKRKKV